MTKEEEKEKKKSHHHLEQLPQCRALEGQR